METAAGGHGGGHSSRRTRQTCYCAWQNGSDLPTSRGSEVGGRKRVRRSKAFPALFPPHRWKGEAEANTGFLSSLSVSPIRSTAELITSKCPTVPRWWHAGCHQARREVRARNSCRSGLLLPVETRTRLNAASYKFLQRRATLQHVARNVAVAMVNIHV